MELRYIPAVLNSSQVWDMRSTLSTWLMLWYCKTCSTNYFFKVMIIFSHQLLNRLGQFLYKYGAENPVSVRHVSSKSRVDNHVIASFKTYNSFILFDLFCYLLWSRVINWIIPHQFEMNTFCVFFKLLKTIFRDSELRSSQKVYARSPKGLLIPLIMVL